MSKRIVALAVCVLALAYACGGSSKNKSEEPVDAGGGRQLDKDAGARDASQPFDAGMEHDGSGPVGFDAGVDGGGPIGGGDGGVPKKKPYVASVGPSYAVSGEGYEYQPKASQPVDGAWKVKDDAPSGVSVQNGGKTLKWTPTKDQSGPQTITVTNKAKGEPVEQTTVVTVAVPTKRAEETVNEKVGGGPVVAAPTSNIQGASVKVAPGGVKGEAQLSISELDKAPAMPNSKGNTRPVKFGPSGMVFSQPALVSLPFSVTTGLDPKRIGAYVYDERGVWERLPIVRVDVTNGLVFARAKHFSTYGSAESALGLDLTLTRMGSSSSCEGSLVAGATLAEGLDQVEAASINSAAPIVGIIEGGASDVLAVISDASFAGSLRVVRVLELLTGEGEEQLELEEQLLVTTLYASGDGSATVTHTDGLGNAIASFAFESIASSLDEIAAHLRGVATRAFFDVDASGALAVAGRMHLVYFEGDVSLDPASVDDLGIAAVDSGATTAAVPVTESGSLDVDCDELLRSYDDTDNRLLPQLVLEPSSIVSALSGSTVRLEASLTNTSKSPTLTFVDVNAMGQLDVVEGNANARDFKSDVVGRHLIEVSATVSGESLSSTFAIDVVAPAALPTCTPVAAQSTLKVGENVVLDAVLGKSNLPDSALSVEWGFVDEGGSLFSDESLTANGREALYAATEPGSYVIGCRAITDVAAGTVGSTELAVLEAGANRLPVDLTLSPGSATITVGESLSLEAAGSDPDDEPLSFAWTTSGGDLLEISEDATSSRRTFSSANAGTFEITVAISDAAGIPQQLTAEIVVVQSKTQLDGADVDEDGWPAALDCNDQNAKVNPGMRDACGDEIDDDCSGSARTEDCDDDGETEANGDCDDADGSVNSAAVERCDGIDNDCDEVVDDGFGVGETCSVGVGACATQAAFRCAPDGASVVCEASPGKPSAEQCNGIDDDCDGATDEGYVSRATSCGVGACSATGATSCVQGREVDSCKAGTPAVDDSLCNGRDDDCDESTDEDYLVTATSCGEGACASTGTKTCVAGTEVDSCKAGTPAASDATCDGVDDDCDATTDEDYESVATSCGQGVCASTGATSCARGKVEDSCQIQPGAETDATCDGKDDDCDGQTDEEYVASETSCGIGACADVGTKTCVAGKEQDSCTVGTPSASDATCDGVDDDCDESVDEDYEPSQITCGIGACEGTGTRSCVAGEELSECSTLVGAPNDALCNGIDDDCDGLADEDVVVLADVCNGIDDDCDGQIDENLSCPTPAEGCTPTGAELCNAADDDCDGLFDEGGACSLTPVAGSMVGTWIDCADPTCTTFGSKGSIFYANGTHRELRGVDDAQSYDPAAGLYCVGASDGSTYTFEGSTLSVSFTEGDVPVTMVGTVTFEGLVASAHWVSRSDGKSIPPDMVLHRIPEQSAGLCPAPVPECQPSEDCKNGFDDDCDGQADGMDADCRPACGNPSTEICDGLDNDCDGLIDDLDGTCTVEAALGICQQGHFVCPQGGGEPVCQAGTPDADGEVCPDGLDNDCDGSVDELGCTELTAGETCFNPIDITSGGVFTVPAGSRNDVMGQGCTPPNGNDRVLAFATPPSQGGAQYVIKIDSTGYQGAMLYAAPTGWAPNQGCPALQNGSCISSGNVFDAYLSGSTTYLLVLESAGGDKAGEGGAETPPSVRVSIARRMDGSCVPADLDGDGVSICDRDCDDTASNVYPAREAMGAPGAPELCDQIDNDCDGIVDDQSGTCGAGLLGACAIGRSVCGAEPSCQPIQTASAVDYCGDAEDNDCDGSVDESCVEGPGETCSNAIDLGAGGTVSGTLVGANDDAVSRCGDAGAGPERFYRLHVPASGASLIFYTPYENRDKAVRYALYRNAPADGKPNGLCTLDPVICELGNADPRSGTWLDGGVYVLAVEGTNDPMQPVPTYELTVGLAADAETCLVGDLDADGYTICDGDCSEIAAQTSGAVNPSGLETDAEGCVVEAGNYVSGNCCDQIDNDCDRQIDDVSAKCAVAGQQGVCAVGALRCNGGAQSCEQTQFGDPQGRDFCGDALDNDCDGQVDEPDCTVVPAGDICSLATNVSAGGVFASTLVGYGDHAAVGCGDGGSAGGPQGGEAAMQGSVERFYTITLAQRRRVEIQVRWPEGKDDGFLGMAVLQDCDASGNYACGGEGLSSELDAGTWTLAVFGTTQKAFELIVTTRLPNDQGGSSCLPGDLDGDGFNLCNGDCDETRSNVNPMVDGDVCDGVDNNCNGSVDERYGPATSCTVEGAIGECAFGEMQCTNGEMQCTGFVTPNQRPEVCADGKDNDCDGSADDNGVAGVDCVVPTAETCELARPVPADGSYLSDTLVGATDDLGGCYGGGDMSNPDEPMSGGMLDEFYRFDAPSPGTLYVNVVPRSVASASFSVGLSAGSCGAASMSCGGGGYAPRVFNLSYAGSYYLSVESGEAFAYDLQLAFRSDGACSAPDGDGDGRTLCGSDDYSDDRDCDDQRDDVARGLPELCDAIDNDCDGQIDNLPTEQCETAQPGVCADGQFVCSGSQVVCAPIKPARPNDICGDTLDNDCDGSTDEAGCDALPPGETCELAVDVTGGGKFTGTLDGASDDGQYCNQAGTADRFFRFTVEETQSVYLEAKAVNLPPQQPNEPAPYLYVTAQIFEDCAAPTGVACATPRLGPYQLMPGTYLIAVEATQAVDFELYVAFGSPESCSAGAFANGDIDGDGYNACGVDCNEANVSVHPGASEVCGNGEDDDCDGSTDSVPYEICTTAQPGDCSLGRFECPPAGGAPVCVPFIEPNAKPELCSDGIDNDCDGTLDEAQCAIASGNTCDAAINITGDADGVVLGTITDPQDDAPGCGGTSTAEMVYRLTPSTSGYLFFGASATGAGAGQFRVRVSEQNCAGPGSCDGAGPYSAVEVMPGMTYYVAVEGPLNQQFQLVWAFRPCVDADEDGQLDCSRFSGDCFPGLGSSGVADTDGDTYSLCNGDCNEANPDVYDGATEVCGDGLDNNCDGNIDIASGSCETGLLGACASGYLSCEASGEPACIAYSQPSPETCNAVDDDCDGSMDEGVCGGGTGGSICGDTALQPGEQCDDGNATSGDGCSASCAVEPGFTCPMPGAPCEPSGGGGGVCGDGSIGPGEVCDDGNINPGDTCSMDCTEICNNALDDDDDGLTDAADPSCGGGAGGGGGGGGGPGDECMAAGPVPLNQLIESSLMGYQDNFPSACKPASAERFYLFNLASGGKVTINASMGVTPVLLGGTCGDLSQLACGTVQNVMLPPGTYVVALEGPNDLSSFQFSINYTP